MPMQISTQRCPHGSGRPDRCSQCLGVHCERLPTPTALDLIAGYARVHAERVSRTTGRRFRQRQRSECSGCGKTGHSKPQCRAGN